MGEVLEFPKPNSLRTRFLAHRVENFRSELCENICIDLQTVKLDTHPANTQRRRMTALRRSPG